MEEEEKKHKLECCCISHEFFKTASENPTKIAVVLASGGAKLIRRRRVEGRVCGGLWDEFSGVRSSASPPIYEGDCWFTYSDVLALVESFAARIRRVLDGGEDACVIKPQKPGVGMGQGRDSGVLTNLKSMGQCCNVEDHYFPKIVGIYMVPSVEYVASVLAVLRCGEAFVPLDPLWPRERILAIDVDLIIGCSKLVDRSSDYQVDAEHWLVQCGCAPALCISLFDRAQAQDPIDLSHIPWPCERKKQRPFCYVLYTSGSSGKPKGVCGTEIGLLNRYFWMKESYPLSTDEVLLFKTSVSFIDHLQEILGPVLSSATVIIPPLSMMKENLFHMVDVIQVYKISRLVCVPTLMKLVLPALRDLRTDDVRRILRLLILSGESFPLSLWESLYKILPETTILNIYGSTEVGTSHPLLSAIIFSPCSLVPFLWEIYSAKIYQTIWSCQTAMMS